MRVSILAISTLSTLIAITLQRLTYSAVTDQFVPPEGAKPEGEDPVKAKQADDPKPIAAVALPEVVVPQKPTSPQAAAPNKRVSHPLPTGMMALLPVPSLPGGILSPPTIHTAPEADSTSLAAEQGVVPITDQDGDRQMPVATNPVHPALLAMTEPPVAMATIPDATQRQGEATSTVMPALRDIQGHWAQPAIEALAQLGAIKGYGDGSFRPEALVTAKQFESMVQQAQPKVAIAYKDLQTFNPRATRAEAVVFLYQSLVKAGQAPILQTASARVVNMAAIFAAADESSHPGNSQAAAEPTLTTVGLTAIPPAIPQLAVEVPVAAPAQAEVVQTEAVQAEVVQTEVVPFDRKASPNPDPVEGESPATVPPPSSQLAANQTLEPAPQLVSSQATSALPVSLPAVEGNPGFVLPEPLPGKTVEPETGNVQAPDFAETTGSDPTDAMAALEADYTLGAGDRLHLEVSGAPADKGDYEVLTDGTLNLPQLGSVAVRGMTVPQASEAIATRYASLLPQVQISLNLLTARPVSVAIAGAVSRPGSYTLPLQADNKFPTLIQAIRLAGGITRTADLRQVQIRRPQAGGAEQQFTLNLWALSQAGTPEHDLTLRDGDLILIPSTVTTNPNLPSQTEASAQATLVN